ncbi:Uncharacterized protein TCAP_06837 [Tolypocladium capitatum]|uniref:Uncharacterized protein n=1 Tax=Tolypocladium capitatum TaxID=45235 RepID=A0A2K3Q6N1_9HYPO|nr:Uncharacterized protein TCAP_06837 [Tolypocladium capitatum]
MADVPVDAPLSFLNARCATQGFKALLVELGELDPDPDADVCTELSSDAGADDSFDNRCASPATSHTMPTRPSIRKAAEYLPADVSMLHDMILRGQMMLVTGRRKPSGSPCRRRRGTDHADLPGGQT